MKKLCRIFLVAAILLLCAALLPTKAQAASSGTCGNNLTWVYDGNGTLTISGTGPMSDYYYANTRTDPAPWDSLSGSICTVVINEGVTSIGDYAFYPCDQLTSITIPKSMERIGSYAFSIIQSSRSKTIKSVYITDLTAWCQIDFNSYPMFRGATLYINGEPTFDLTIPNSITSINKGAFWGCNLTSVTIPGTVTDVGENAFMDCANLSSVTIQEGVKTIGEGAFSGCKSLTSIVIPSGVTIIEHYLFRFCSNLTSVTLPEGVTYIGARVFDCCHNLESINIPSTVRGIGGSTFEKCYNLSNITLPKGMTRISSGLFDDCRGLKSITIPDTVTLIEDHAFDDCNNMEAIYYEGSVAEWKRIRIEDYNYYLRTDNLHFGRGDCDHTWGGGQTTKQPTCKESGEKTYTCSYCKGIKTEEIPKLTTHRYGSWYNISDSIHGRLCADCNIEETASHSWDSGKTTVQPSCQADGVKTYTCSACKATKTEPIPQQTAHSYSQWYNITSSIHGRICSGCNHEETAAHSWDSGRITVHPNCQADGVKTYTCTVCQATRTEPIPGGGVHNWNNGTVTDQPTADREGTKTYTCTICGQTKTEVVPKLSSHTYGMWTNVNDSTHKRVCSVCGKEETASHSWDSGRVTKQPTCKEDGIKTYSCACGATHTEALPQGEHNWDGGKVTKRATCMEEGVKTYTCQTCRTTHTEVVPKATEHTYANACDTDCNICGATRTVSHKYKTGWSKDTSSHWHECSVCGDKKDISSHKPGAAATETTAQICTACGYELAPATGTTTPTTPGNTSTPSNPTTPGSPTTPNNPTTPNTPATPGDPTDNDSGILELIVIIITVGGIAVGCILLVIHDKKRSKQSA